jgi:hypothetical protein
MNRKTPKVFLSYSWDNKVYMEWVATLGDRLRSDGIDVWLDQWQLVPGDQLPEFMEKAIRNNDYVLILCTPNYKQKSDSRKGGVGYEGDIMTGEVFTGSNRRKFIPVLAGRDWSASAPSWLLGSYYVDLSKEKTFDENYRKLLVALFDDRPKISEIGDKPYSSEKVIEFLRPSRDKNWIAKESVRETTQRLGHNLRVLGVVASIILKPLFALLIGFMLVMLDIGVLIVWIVKFDPPSGSLMSRIPVILLLVGSIYAGLWMRYLPWKLLGLLFVISLIVFIVIGSYFGPQ